MQKSKWALTLLVLVFLCVRGQAKSVRADEVREDLPAQEMSLVTALGEGFFLARVDGSTATVPMVEAIKEHLWYWTQDEVKHSTTPVAYERLCKGEVDLILVTPPSPEDLQIAKDAGVELEVIPIAREALIFLDNVQNPIAGLSQEQLRDIYMGRITNWSEVGGQDAAILPYQRDTRSGSQTLFLECLMRGQVPMAPDKDIVASSMNYLIDQVSSYDNAEHALGYSVYYYVSRMYLSDAVRVLSIDGVAPSVETIEDGSYPLCTQYFAVLRKDAPPQDKARQLVAWMLGDAGQELIAKAGYGRLQAEERLVNSGAAWEKTHLSSGTGGKEPREQVTYSWAETRPPIPAATRKMAKRWMAQAALELGKKVEAKDLDELQSESSALLNLGMATYDEDDFDITYLRSAVIDMEKKRAMKLSDVFFDGFNYINYINSNIAFMPKETDINNWEESRGIRDNPGERLFSGLPRDYPYFAMQPQSQGMQYVEILFDSASGLWKPYYESTQVRLFVPLAHWASPWGGCIVKTVYKERRLPGNVKFTAPLLRIDEGRVPQAEAKINAVLANISEELIGEQAQWQETATSWVEARTQQAGQYALVTYWLWDYSEIGDDAVRPLRYGLFDLHTGESFDLQAICAEWKGDPQARFYQKFFQTRGRGLLKGYQPPEAIVPENISLLSFEGEPSLCVHFYESGDNWNYDKQKTMVLPLSALVMGC